MRLPERGSWSNEGSFIDRALAYAKPMDAMLQREVKEFVHRQPCIIRMESRTPMMLGHVKDSVDLLAKKWSESEEKRATGRLLKPLRNAQIQDILWKTLKEGLLFATGTRSLPPLNVSSRTLEAASVLEPAAFAIGQGKECISHEKHFLASARVLHQGNRTVIAAPISAVVEVMAAEGSLEDNESCKFKKPSDAVVRDFFAGASHESLQALAGLGALLHGTGAKKRPNVHAFWIPLCRASWSC